MESSMTPANIALRRLRSQQLERPGFERAGEVVAWLGAVQAQDYLAALWALGLRLPQASEATIEAAIADRSVLRTWALRGTLHFVAPADIRWLLGLIAPGALARQAPYHRRLELDEATFARSQALMAKALAGGQPLTRQELAGVLERGGISTRGLRLSFLLYRAALDGLICLGPRRGKQFTCTLLEEWAPAGAVKARDEALAELARRYFTGHGPATLKDFTWWSGLRAAEAREGLELAKAQLAQETIDGQSYWLAPDAAEAGGAPPDARLLPAFDEFLVGYSDRSALVDAPYRTQVSSGSGLLNPTLLLGGRVVGTWKRTLGKGRVAVAFSPFGPLNVAQGQALAAAARRYAEFLGMELI